MPLGTFEIWAMRTVNLFNNKHTGRRKIHAHPLREAVRSQCSSWGLERPGAQPGQFPASLARTLWAGTTAWHAQLPARRRSSCTTSPPRRALSTCATGWTGLQVSGQSRVDCVFSPLPFLSRDYKGHSGHVGDNLLRACGWMSWEHSSTKEPQPHSMVSKTNSLLPVSFLWPFFAMQSSSVMYS